MNAADMAEAERLFGITDWTSPQASAMYWAMIGLRRAKGQNVAFLNGVIRQSASMMTAGRAFAEPRKRASEAR